MNPKPGFYYVLQLPGKRGKVEFGPYDSAKQAMQRGAFEADMNGYGDVEDVTLMERPA